MIKIVRQSSVIDSFESLKKEIDSRTLSFTVGDEAEFYLDSGERMVMQVANIQSNSGDVTFISKFARDYSFVAAACGGNIESDLWAYSPERYYLEQCLCDELPDNLYEIIKSVQCMQYDPVRHVSIVTYDKIWVPNEEQVGRKTYRNGALPTLQLFTGGNRQRQKIAIGEDEPRISEQEFWPLRDYEVAKGSTLMDVIDYRGDFSQRGRKETKGRGLVFCFTIGAGDK